MKMIILLKFTEACLLLKMQYVAFTGTFKRILLQTLWPMGKNCFRFILMTLHYFNQNEVDMQL